MRIRKDFIDNSSETCLIEWSIHSKQISPDVFFSTTMNPINERQLLFLIQISVLRLSNGLISKGSRTEWLSLFLEEWRRDSSIDIDEKTVIMQLVFCWLTQTLNFSFLIQSDLFVNEDHSEMEIIELNVSDLFECCRVWSIPKDLIDWKQRRLLCSVSLLSSLFYREDRTNREEERRGKKGGCQWRRLGRENEPFSTFVIVIETSSRHLTRDRKQRSIRILFRVKTIDSCRKREMNVGDCSQSMSWRSRTNCWISSRCRHSSSNADRRQCHTREIKSMFVFSNVILRIRSSQIFQWKEKSFLRRTFLSLWISTSECLHLSLSLFSLSLPSLLWNGTSVVSLSTEISIQCWKTNEWQILRHLDPSWGVWSVARERNSPDLSRRKVIVKIQCISRQTKVSWSVILLCLSLDIRRFERRDEIVSSLIPFLFNHKCLVGHTPISVVINFDGCPRCFIISIFNKENWNWGRTHLTGLNGVSQLVHEMRSANATDDFFRVNKFG